MDVMPAPADPGMAGLPPTSRDPALSERDGIGAPTPHEIPAQIKQGSADPILEVAAHHLQQAPPTPPHNDQGSPPVASSY